LKGEHVFEIPNVHNLYATSNYSDAIPLDVNERRWFCIWTNATRMTTKESDAIWLWYRSGGLQAVAHWLKHRDVSKFQPHAPAPDTDWKSTLAESGYSEIEAMFHTLIDKREGGPFRHDLVSPADAADYINHDIDRGRRLGDAFSEHTGALSRRVTAGQVGTALTQAGWVRLALDMKRHENGKEVERLQITLFASPSTSQQYVQMRKKSGHRAVLQAWQAMAGIPKGAP
jgi:hypothetical protein